MSRKEPNAVSVIVVVAASCLVGAGIAFVLLWMIGMTAEVETPPTRDVPSVDVTDEYDSEQLRIDYEIAIDLIEPVYRGDPEVFCADYWADPWRHVNDFVDGFLSQAPDEIGYLVSRTQMIHDIETRILRACPGA